MTTRNLVDLLKPGLSLVLTATLALGQKITVPNNEAPPVREQSAVWGSFKPDPDPAPTSAGARKGKIAVDLQSYNPKDSVDVIVQYKAVPTEAHRQRVARLGGKLSREMDFINAGQYTLSAEALANLADDPEVEFIAPNRPVHSMIDTPALTVNAMAAATARYDGTGIGVAIIDSGMSDIPQFHGSSTRIIYQKSFATDTTSTVDKWGHGTHVAGLIGSDGNGTLYTGIVPNVNLINLRALDANGSGTDASVINAINAAISLKSRYNIRVMNLSLGRPVSGPAANDPLCKAVEAAWKAGIVVVVAAGNEGRNNSAKTQGYGTITAPGNSPYAITVGAMKDMGTATRADDQMASYSSKGPTLFDHYAKPDILAPGNKVVSTIQAGKGLLQAYPQNKVANDMYVLSGTSMATPLVSGAAVVLIQKNPSLTPDQVKARLMKTASKGFPASSVATDPATKATYTTYYDLFTVRAGYLDIAAALADTTVATGAALSPATAYDATTGKVTLQGIGNANIIWGSNVVWGTSMVWGSSIVWGSSVVWGSNVVWGASGTQGFSVVWGSNMVWGAGAVATESNAIAIDGEP